MLDIGSAPGGWSELVKALTPSSNIYSIDLLPMDPIEGVLFFQEDVLNIDKIKEIFVHKSYKCCTFSISRSMDPDGVDIVTSSPTFSPIKPCAIGV